MAFLPKTAADAADHQLLSTVWAELFSGFIFTRLFTAWRFLKQFGDNHQLTHLTAVEKAGISSHKKRVSEHDGLFRFRKKHSI